MSTITEVVRESLQDKGLGHYARQPEVASVIAVLEDRETAIRDNLLNFAVTSGLPREQAKTAITEAGLEFPAPVLQAVNEPFDLDTEAPEEGDVMAILRSIQESVTRMGQTVASLSTFARRNGYNG